MQNFQNVKRRLEIIGQKNGVTIYDDFAHHPTAIATTLNGLRQYIDNKRLLAILEPRSNTMKLGVHREQLIDSLKAADKVLVFQPPSQNWQFPTEHSDIQIFQTTEELLKQLLQTLQADDHVVIMSNGGFENLHQRLLKAL